MVDIEKLKIAASGKPILDVHNKPPSLDALDRVFGLKGAQNPADLEIIVRELWKYLKDMNDGFGVVNQAFQLIWNRVSGLVTAEANITITSDMLSTTSETNDTLTTLSQTDYEFDWTDGQRLNRVLLSPGAGVRPMDLRFDMVLSDLPELQGTVYAKSATTLQLMTWDGSDWNASAWDTGWNVRCLQVIPALLPGVT